MNHIIKFAGHMRPLTEADLDARIAENRARFDEAFERIGCQLGHAQSRPSVIPLDSSLLARGLRWVAGSWRVLAMRYRVWRACRGLPPF